MLFTCAQAVVALVVSVASVSATSQTYPSKPIRIVVPYPPAAGPDIISRIVGNRLTAIWGQQVVADNRAGAGGNLGADIAARALPDGYTLVMLTGGHAIAVTLYPKLNYDLLKDFAPISLVASAPYLLAVNPTIQATSVKELVVLAKMRPGDVRYGSGGSGSPSHLAAEIFRSMTGTELIHVPYKGATPIVADLVSGQIQMSFLVVPVALQMVRSGKLRAIGVSGAKRSSLVTDLPTIAESLPNFEVIGWYALLAPSGVSRDIVLKINAETVKAVKLPEVQTQLTAIGAEPIGSTPQELTSYMRNEISKFGKAVRDSGARIE